MDSEHEAIAVNHLRVGQQLRLASGGTAPIQWIGYRRVDCRRHPQPDKVWPVRIKAGAFGEGLPLRDLFLSPEHAVFIDGGMVPIRCLINGTTIAQITTNEVTYYHVELAEHDVILAEGLPCESYLAVGGRAEFENGGGVQRLFLDFSTPSLDAFMLWETKACAPLVQCGPRLEAARAFINARTRAMDSPSSMKAA